MCSTTKAVNLKTAILMQVQEFAKQNKSFSVHDITRTLRTKTSSGELQIPEIEVKGCSIKYSISHSDVKDEFNELRKTGKFEESITIDRKYNGMYFDYTPTFKTPTISQGSSVTITTNSYPSAIPSVPDFISHNNALRVQTYLGKRIGNPPTLKQVQSAIKRHDVPGQSCSELKRYLQTLGYTLSYNPNAVSKSIVMI